MCKASPGLREGSPAFPSLTHPPANVCSGEHKVVLSVDTDSIRSPCCMACPFLQKKVRKAPSGFHTRPSVHVSSAGTSGTLLEAQNEMPGELCRPHLESFNPQAPEAG